MIPLCEVSRTDKSTETKSRLVVSGGWGTMELGDMIGKVLFEVIKMF